MLDSEFNYKKQINELKINEVIKGYSDFNLKLENERLKKENRELRKYCQEVVNLKNAVEALLQSKELTPQQKQILMPFIERIVRAKEEKERSLSLAEHLGAIIAGAIKQR